MGAKTRFLAGIVPSSRNRRTKKTRAVPVLAQARLRRIPSIKHAYGTTSGRTAQIGKLPPESRKMPHTLEFLLIDRPRNQMREALLP